jgi:hypothetical protein
MAGISLVHAGASPLVGVVRESSGGPSSATSWPASAIPKRWPGIATAAF